MHREIIEKIDGIGFGVRVQNGKTIKVALLMQQFTELGDTLSTGASLPHIEYLPVFDLDKGLNAQQ